MRGILIAELNKHMQRKRFNNKQDYAPYLLENALFRYEATQEIPLLKSCKQLEVSAQLICSDAPLVLIKFYHKTVDK